MKTIRNEIFKQLLDKLTDKDFNIIASADLVIGEEFNGKLQTLVSICKEPFLFNEVHWEIKEELCLTKWCGMLHIEDQTLSGNEIYRTLLGVLILIEWGTKEKLCEQIFGLCNEIIVAIDCVNRLGNDWCELLYFYLKIIYSETNVEIMDEDFFYLTLGILILDVTINVSSEETKSNINNVIKAHEHHKYLMQSYDNNTEIMKSCSYMQSEGLWKRYLDSIRHLYPVSLWG